MSLEAQFSKQLAEGKENRAISEFRKKAFSRFKDLSIPKSENESWRKVPLSNFHPDEFSEVSEPAALTVNAPKGVKVFRVEDLQERESGIFVETLESIFEKRNEEWFVLLSLSCFTHGLYVEVEDDRILAEEIQIRYRQEKGNRILPLTVVRIGDRSKAFVSERYESSERENLKFFQGLTALDSGNGTKLFYAGIESFGSSVFHFQNLFSDQKRDSDVKIAKVTPGGYKGKNLLNVELSGKGARARVLGLAPMAAREFQDSEVKIIHKESHTESSILYRGALRDKAHHIFTGNLQIPNSCKDVNAIQINNNLLLDRTARAESIPKLEVYAENVKCEHGATVGEIDEEQLFYLASRGIDEDEARRMIVDGFLGEVIGEIESEPIREELFRLIADKVEGSV
ncbi:Fe-S cluster assembly protein SufD [Leptospira ellisii]|uniref:Fe-S cluster assembly protein SufD n=1 Tax=Leptospira ellisii TaxID=2023197 RepID=A0A2N0B7G2_9LEPT|nr:Fe-S cluster assembly protein SufD [Leptospira ellisii]MDV6235964.1 Fe-S cluster assembly protein SufD [Leptospira ellisii]PJZ92470.1 Fe-S cluster assembly protein SufD [Leptospira ellisii]